MSTQDCQTCRILWLAMGGAIANPMELIAGSVRAVTARDRCEAADLVVVVGQRGLGLPLEDVAVGPFVFGAVSREAIAEWAGDDAERRRLVAAAAEPPPAGRVWILAGAGTKSSGLVTLVNHDLPAPSARADLIGELALVPRDGGPAPGRRVVRGGEA